MNEHLLVLLNGTSSFFMYHHFHILFTFWKKTLRKVWYDPMYEQGKSEGFDSSDRPSNLTQIGFKSSIFQPLWPWNLMDDPEKQ